MQKIKTGVVGVGYLGQFHAEKYSLLPGSHLVAVCDSNPERSTEIAQKFQTTGYSEYQDLVSKVEAVSIAVPTPSHYETAKFFLEKGIHVLLEKPMTTEVHQAQELIEIAKKKDVILQVGHIERFNNVMRAVYPLVHQPFFFEAIRYAPFKLRGADVNVILDLMIHDIDLIQTLAQSEISEIRASGFPMTTATIDIAQARIEFKNGCVANLSVSRINPSLERKLKIYQRDCYIELDLDHKKMSIHRSNLKRTSNYSELVTEEQQFEKGDALKDQIESFLQCIRDQQSPVVTGEDGCRSLMTAIQVTNAIHQQLERRQEKIYV